MITPKKVRGKAGHSAVYAAALRDRLRIKLPDVKIKSTSQWVTLKLSYWSPFYLTINTHFSGIEIRFPARGMAVTWDFKVVDIQTALENCRRVLPQIRTADSEVRAFFTAQQALSPSGK